MNRNHLIADFLKNAENLHDYLLDLQKIDALQEKIELKPDFSTLNRYLQECLVALQINGSVSEYFCQVYCKKIFKQIRGYKRQYNQEILQQIIFEYSKIFFCVISMNKSNSEFINYIKIALKEYSMRKSNDFLLQRAISENLDLCSTSLTHYCERIENIMDPKLIQSVVLDFLKNNISHFITYRCNVYLYFQTGNHFLKKWIEILYKTDFAGYRGYFFNGKFHLRNRSRIKKLICCKKIFLNKCLRELSAYIDIKIQEFKNTDISEYKDLHLLTDPSDYFLIKSVIDDPWYTIRALEATFYCLDLKPNSKEILKCLEKIETLNDLLISKSNMNVM